jgi:hypothetical protein
MKTSNREIPARIVNRLEFAMTIPPSSIFDLGFAPHGLKTGRIADLMESASAICFYQCQEI